LLLLQEFLQGRDISAKLDLIINEKNISDKYSQILIPLLQAFSALQKQDYDSFGNYIYTAKVQADYFNFYQAKYFCDLMIAFAYHMLGNAKKAKQILYSVLDAVEERGIKLVNYLAIYLLAKFEFENNEKNISISILNNSLILNEQDQNISDIIIILFKILTAEIMITSGSSFEQALFSAEQAFDIALKNNYHIFINKIANILTYIYNVAITTNQDENVVAEFQAKFENLNNIIAHFNKN